MIGKQKKISGILLGCILLLTLLNLGCKRAENVPSKVTIKKEGSVYIMEVNGKPFYAKGAGIEFGNIEALKKHGGNCFRTWRTQNSKEDAVAVLDSAQKLGLMVLMGLEVGHERHGFDYDDTVWVRQQYNYLKGEVERLKNHPALLGWAIGNELNLNSEKLKAFDAVNDISKMIHQIDPNHPTTTTLAGIGKREVDYIRQHCSDIDFISVQFYGDIINLQQRIKDSGWDGPYMVTEWGATGHWEVAKTDWGASIENTSTEKARDFVNRYEKAIKPDSARCLGSFVFLWGQKQEKTPTWYGMFLESGEETETVDAMHYVWNNKWPENRCPYIHAFTLNKKTAYDNIKVKRNSTLIAEVESGDYDKDTLKYRWEIIPESTDLGVGGDFESRPESLLTARGGPSIQLIANQMPGAYRLYVYIFDGKEHAATANIPFYIED
jgi:hypothetical protein